MRHSVARFDFEIPRGIRRSEDYGGHLFDRGLRQVLVRGAIIHSMRDDLGLIGTDRGGDGVSAVGLPVRMW
jgi:hypothetical protein